MYITLSNECGMYKQGLNDICSYIKGQIHNFLALTLKMTSVFLNG